MTPSFYKHGVAEDAIVEVTRYPELKKLLTRMSSRNEAVREIAEADWAAFRKKSYEDARAGIRATVRSKNLMVSKGVKLSIPMCILAGGMIVALATHSFQPFVGVGFAMAVLYVFSRLATWRGNEVSQYHSDPAHKQALKLLSEFEPSQAVDVFIEATIWREKELSDFAKLQVEAMLPRTDKPEEAHFEERHPKILYHLLTERQENRELLLIAIIEFCERRQDLDGLSALRHFTGRSSNEKRCPQAYRKAQECIYKLQPALEHSQLLQASTNPLNSNELLRPPTQAHIDTDALLIPSDKDETSRRR